MLNANVTLFSLKYIKDWIKCFTFHAYLCTNVSSLAKTKEIQYNKPRIIEDKWSVDIYLLRPKRRALPNSNYNPLLLKIKRFYYFCFENATVRTTDKNSIDYHVDCNHTFAVISTKISMLKNFQEDFKEPKL